uniref:PNPLA domain-containing protein n=1 Tax=Rhabditophanes sp. KR3021 TaxID=114890 RepID=A0AC35U5M0_9BILA
MAPTKCAHEISQKKKILRIQNLMAYCKTATKDELTEKLHQTWDIPQASITDVRLLFVLGANPQTLYTDNYGSNKLAARENAGTICSLCSEKYKSFLKKAQIIYDAQFKSTPITLCSKGSPACSSVDGFSSNTSFSSTNGSSGKGFIALSLDGGGMRGLVSVICLLFASRRIFGDESLIDMVDWTIGTSTGSLLALSLAKGNTLTQAFFDYWEMKNEIFLDKSTMSRLFGNAVEKQTNNLDNVLSQTFPPETFTFKNYKKRMTVPALDISTTPARLHTFRNYPYGDGVEYDDVTFKDAARASGAAPTYFHPHEMDNHKFVDGSLAANCPLNILFREYDCCRQNKQECSLACIISIGTGEPTETKRRYKSGNSIKERTKHIVHVSELLLEQVVGYEKSILECCQDRCRANNIPFFRINPTGIADRIDQIDNGKLTDMIWKALIWLEDNSDMIDDLGKTLKDIHESKNINQTEEVAKFVNGTGSVLNGAFQMPLTPTRLNYRNRSHTIL